MSREPLSSDRRDLLKVVAAGTGLAALGGAATAQDDGEPGADGATGTVHEVRTLVGPSTNPERPADFYYQPTGLAVQPGDVVKWVFETPDHNVVSYHPAFGMRRRVPTGVDAFSSPLLGWKPSSIPGDQIEPPAEMGGGDGEEMAGEGTATPGGTPTGGVTPGEEEEATPTADGEEAPGRPVPDTWLYAFDAPGVYDLLCSPHETFGMAMRVVVGEVTGAPFETSDPEALAEPRAGPVGLSRLTLTDPALEPSAIVEQGTVAWEDLEANQGGGTGGGTPTGTPEGTPSGEETPTEGGETPTPEGTPTDGGG